MTHIVDLALERRHATSVILSDPVIIPFFSQHEPFRRVLDRLNQLLMGDDAGSTGRLATTMLMAAISGAVMHPLFADLDDDTLRPELLHLARRFLDLPG